MRTNVNEFSKTTWFFGIAVGHLQRKQADPLKSPPIDIAKLRLALENKEGCAVPKKNIVCLTNEEATRETILTTLRELIEVVPSEGILIVYFGGHAIEGDNAFYLLNYDADTTDPNRTCISSEQLNLLLNRSRARGVLVILDCCYSAAFAEHAPEFFRNLKDKEFKILLSASRAHQLSRELNTAPGGTLFTNHLITAINGDRRIGSASGLIYFTDIFNFIHAQLSEDYEITFPGIPKQEPVFAGVFGRDPLLFVHRRLTLEQIRIKTARYSKEYVTRLIRRISISATVVIALTLMFTYIILDNHRFIQVGDNGRVTEYRGYPGVPFMGFPYPVWEYHLTSSSFEISSALEKGQAVEGVLGKEVFPLMLQSLKALDKAWVFHWMKNDSMAHVVLFSALATNSIAGEDDMYAAMTLAAKVVKKDDADVIYKYARTGYFSVREKAIGILSRLDLGRAIDIALNESHVTAVGPRSTTSLNNFVMRSMDGECTTEKLAFLRINLTMSTSGYTQGLAAATALNLGCALSPDEVLQGILNIYGTDGYDDIAMYADFQSIEYKTKLNELLTSALRAPQSPLKKFGILRVLANINSFAYIQSVAHFVSDPDPYVSKTALRVILANCRENSQLNSYAKRKDLTVSQKALLCEYGIVDFHIGIQALKQTDIDYERYDLIRALENINNPELNHYMISLLSRPDVTSNCKLEILRQLRKKNFEPIRAKEFIGIEGLEMFAYRWYLLSDQQKAINELLGRLSEPRTGYIPAVLIGYTLTEDQVKRVKAIADSINSALSIATKVLAVSGPPEEVVKLLTNPRVDIRMTASQYAPVNKRFSEINDILKNYTGPVNETISFVQDQWRIKRDFDEQIASCTERTKQWWIKRAYSSGYELSDGLSEYFRMFEE